MEPMLTPTRRQPSRRARRARTAKMSIRALDFFYGKFHALKNVNLDIAERQVTAFIGPSGCGKSTLLRTLNRMYSLYPGQRATGEILFNGANILDPGIDLNMLRAKVGMVFQKPTPFPMSIYDNIAFGVRLYESLSPRRDGRARRMGADQGGDVGRGEGQAEAERHGAVRRPAAAAVHRARGRGASPRCCCSTSRPPRSTRSRPRRSRS